MKKTIKKIFVVSFFVALFLCMTALFASAETWKYNNKNYELQVEGDFNYALVKKGDLHANEADCDGGAIIVKYTGTASSVAIPTTLGGEPVFYVYGSSFKDNKAIQTVTIGESVKVIGGSAFENCTGLQTALIAKNVDRIYGNVFKGCTALKTVTFQKGSVLRSIGESAFNNCTSLNNFVIPETVKSIGTWAFRGCDSLIEIIIPDSVNELGGGVFYHCDSLFDVKIGNGVTKISDAYDWGVCGAFEHCISLKNVTFGFSLSEICVESFMETDLEKIVIPDNVVTIGDSVFRDCKLLSSVKIGDGVTSIGNDVFRNCTALTDVEIGKGVSVIGDWAFTDCDALEYIYIPSNVTKLGCAAFFNCDNLKKAVIGNGVVSLVSGYDWGDVGTFEKCINLETVILGSGIISIGGDTFEGTQITTLTIPSKVSTLSNYAFSSATQLKDIYFTGNWAASVGDNIFNNIADGYTVHYISGKIGYDDLSYNKATFTPVTVTFDNNNDDVFAAPTESQILAPVGGYVIEPINPTAFGYIFVGWYKDADCRQPWNFETDKVTSDVTLYAKWNAIDEVAPLRPENISTETKDGNSITLKWSAVDGATGYNVYIDEEKVNDSTILTTSYKVSGLESSTTYEFVVRAVNSKGESPDSLIFADRTTDHVHAFGEWTVVKESTCGADGEKTRSCECGTVEKEAIPATGIHTYGDWYTTLEPTCVDKGEQTRSCSACGKNETKEVSATGEHNYGNWVVVKEATQDAEGLKERTCNDCSKTEAQVIPSLSSVLKGDVNGDGKISAADARMVLRAAAKLEVLSPDVFEIAEVTGDGKITAADARKILRVSARLEEM